MPINEPTSRDLPAEMTAEIRLAMTAAMSRSERFLTHRECLRRVLARLGTPGDADGLLSAWGYRPDALMRTRGALLGTRTVQALLDTMAATQARQSIQPIPPNTGRLRLEESE
ncbi:hypothetical protein CCR95_22285 [Thiocystis minor]|uniref:hypothetical protein n=1 Tax=Thiocystis minor TaxID=61597 RepID=UPI001912ED14|nr:hypothetical protein [Thiocystis minor]MBK5966728.1 hypothetical protein [Thiocystis minor]